MKNYISICLILFLFSCSKKNDIRITSTNSFEQSLKNKIDYVLDSTTCRGGFDRMIQVRHQKYDGKDFIQIASVYDYNPKYLFYCMEYKGQFISIYNKEFFEKKITYNKPRKDSLLKKYKNFDINNEIGIISEKRCFEIFEISHNYFRKIPHNSFYYNNLFADSFLIAPPPPPFE